MGHLTSFGKPAFWPIRIASLFFRTTHVIIYFCSLLLHKVGYCTLTQYILVLWSNFSLLCVNFACLISNFVSVIVLSLGFNFHKRKANKDSIVFCVSATQNPLWKEKGWEIAVVNLSVSAYHNPHFRIRNTEGGRRKVKRKI